MKIGNFLRGMEIFEKHLDNEGRQEYILAEHDQIWFCEYEVVTDEEDRETLEELGWWGMSSETNEGGLNWELNFYDKFIKDLSDDTLLTIVDCHI